jgi:hypothetical protein
MLYQTAPVGEMEQVGPGVHTKTNPGRGLSSEATELLSPSRSPGLSALARARAWWALRVSSRSTTRRGRDPRRRAWGPPAPEASRASASESIPWDRGAEGKLGRVARTLSIRVELVEGRGQTIWPRPGRVFAAARSHTFAELADAIDTATPPLPGPEVAICLPARVDKLGFDGAPPVPVWPNSTVARVGVERRIEVYEVYGLSLDVAP